MGTWASRESFPGKVYEEPKFYDSEDEDPTVDSITLGLTCFTPPTFISPFGLPDVRELKLW